MFGATLVEVAHPESLMAMFHMFYLFAIILSVAAGLRWRCIRSWCCSRGGRSQNDGGIRAIKRRFLDCVTRRTKSRREEVAGSFCSGWHSANCETRGRVY